MSLTSREIPTAIRHIIIGDDPFDNQLIENCHHSNWVNPTFGGEYYFGAIDYPVYRFIFLADLEDADLNYHTGAQ